MGILSRTLDGTVACDECDGTGKCSNCHGSGEVSDIFHDIVHGIAGVDEDDCAYDTGCPECNGTGKCHNCDGTGDVEGDEGD